MKKELLEASNDLQGGWRTGNITSYFTIIGFYFILEFVILLQHHYRWLSQGINQDNKKDGYSTLACAGERSRYGIVKGPWKDPEAERIGIFLLNANLHASKIRKSFISGRKSLAAELNPARKDTQD